MQLSVSQSNGHAILTVSGEVDLSTSPQLDGAVIDAVAQELTHLTIDLSNVSFLDSSGLSVIVKALKRSRDAGAKFDVVATNERVLKVFSITGLDTVITIYSAISAVPTA